MMEPQRANDIHSEASRNVQNTIVADQYSQEIRCTEKPSFGDSCKKIVYKYQKKNIPQLTREMTIRLKEGQGETIYGLGLSSSGESPGLTDEELDECLNTLTHAASQLNAECQVLTTEKTGQGKIAEVLVRKQTQNDHFKLDVRVTVLGEADSGKSTLIGVLTTNAKDNGKGSARQSVFRHKHEVEDGRTSSVSFKILGFDSKGNKITARGKSWENLVRTSSKIVTLVDVGGDGKYINTMFTGLCAHTPDYVFISISGEVGVTETTRQHLKLALTLGAPVVLVVTKLDKMDEDQIFDLSFEIKSLLREGALSKHPITIKSNEDVVLCSRNLDENIIPVFFVSNVTLQGIDALTNFLNLIPVSQSWAGNQGNFPEFLIDESFPNHEEDMIVTGMVIQGSLRKYQPMLLGPDNDGGYRLVEIRDIHCKRVDVRSAVAGQSCSIAITMGQSTIKWLNSIHGIRKGMVLVDPKLKPRAYWEFDAEVISFRKEVEEEFCSWNHQPIIHTQTIRQAARIISVNHGARLEQPSSSDPNNNNNKFCISANQKQIIRFRFMYHPEYLKQGQKMIINDQHLKIVGEVTQTLPGQPARN
eukprot:CAMPEP_0114973722 /NCGR_PEP_ID=MMETSP0216-20121206/1119_1 /TAXON_ID=223996 /ORGANISM="Protocruzia adherens, Strain Boccale" /LENGTH=587 /DNA_ID=CAMNT_0002334259 /DNA_START=140 /DNA_END=1903 /DNA_ORIENTATION=-